MQKIKMISVTIALFFIFATPVKAILGAGDIVFDASTYLGTLLNYFQQVYAVQNQLQQLQNEAANLANMDAGTQQSTMNAIQSKLRQLSAINNGVRGLTMDYAKVEKAFDQLYPDFSKYNGMSGEDYAKQATATNQQTQNAVADAMKAQGLTANIGQDQDSLTALMNASQSSTGALSAVQVGNQIAAMNVQQLMQLQQIMASSQRAQSSYLAQQASTDAAARQNLKKQFTFTQQNKTNPSQGFKQY